MGIIEAYRNGVVTSTTLMTNMPEVDHALELIQNNPGIGVGIHLVLTAGKPLSKNVPSLVDENGRFRKLSDELSYIKSEEVEKEFAAQIEKFYSFGITPTHIDSHHHVHMYNNIYPIVERLAKKHKLPIRKIDMLGSDSHRTIKTTKFFSYNFYGENVNYQSLESILEQCEEYESGEIMCHPAYVDYCLLNRSSYNIQRAKELYILTNSRIIETIKKRNIELINYKNL